MARRSTPDSRPFPSTGPHDDAHENQRPRLAAHFSEIRQRAAQWDATGALLAAAVASRPTGHATTAASTTSARAGALSQPGGGRERRAGAARSGANHSGGASNQSSNESWQYRQLELLERIDENIRRLRELQESARSPQIAFTEPAY